MIIDRYYEIIETHFNAILTQDVLEFNDGYSRVLAPRNLTGTALDHVVGAIAEVLVASGMARWRHVNHHTFKVLFEKLSQMTSVPIILETGSSAYGTNSSLLFANLALSTGGFFTTVDLNSDTVNKLIATLYEKIGVSNNYSCNHGDSIDFINRYKGPKINVAYLDSYDLNPGNYSASETHGLQEFQSLLPHLSAGTSFILVDDTPRTSEIYRKVAGRDALASALLYKKETGRLPGKGALIPEVISLDPRFTILEWEYQLLVQCSM
jgi:hypothetical protein